MAKSDYGPVTCGRIPAQMASSVKTRCQIQNALARDRQAFWKSNVRRLAGRFLLGDEQGFFLNIFDAKQRTEIDLCHSELLQIDFRAQEHDAKVTRCHFVEVEGKGGRLRVELTHGSECLAILGYLQLAMAHLVRGQS